MYSTTLRERTKEQLRQLVVSGLNVNSENGDRQAADALSALLPVWRQHAASMFMASWELMHRMPGFSSAGITGFASFVLNSRPKYDTIVAVAAAHAIRLIAQHNIESAFYHLKSTIEIERLRRRPSVLLITLTGITAFYVARAECDGSTNLAHAAEAAAEAALKSQHQQEGEDDEDDEDDADVSSFAKRRRVNVASAAAPHRPNSEMDIGSISTAWDGIRLLKLVLQKRPHCETVLAHLIEFMLLECHKALPQDPLFSLVPLLSDQSSKPNQTRTATSDSDSDQDENPFAFQTRSTQRLQLAVENQSDSNISDRLKRIYNTLQTALQQGQMQATSTPRNAPRTAWPSQVSLRLTECRQTLKSFVANNGVHTGPSARHLLLSFALKFGGWTSDELESEALQLLASDALSSLAFSLILDRFLSGHVSLLKFVHMCGARIDALQSVDQSAIRPSTDDRMARFSQSWSRELLTWCDEALKEPPSTVNCADWNQQTCWQLIWFACHHARDDHTAMCSIRWLISTRFGHWFSRHFHEVLQGVAIGDSTHVLRSLLRLLSV